MKLQIHTADVKETIRVKGVDEAVNSALLRKLCLLRWGLLARQEQAQVPTMHAQSLADAASSALAAKRRQAAQPSSCGGACLVPASLVVAQARRCELSADQTLESGGCELGVCGEQPQGRSAASPAA